MSSSVRWKLPRYVIVSICAIAVFVFIWRLSQKFDLSRSSEDAYYLNRQSPVSLLYDVPVFTHDRHSKHRIPVLAMGPISATLVLFVEQRIHNISDSAAKNIAYKYSTDGARTWLVQPHTKSFTVHFNLLHD